MSWTLRFAEWVGRSVGRWQRHRASQRDDAYVRRWKAAWCAGRDARWAGAAKEATPFRRAVQRQAWLAGWLWASTQPDRRNPLRPDRRMQSRTHPTRRAGDALPNESARVETAREGAAADGAGASDDAVA